MKTLELKVKADCPYCDGTGRVEGGYVECNSCRGKGKVKKWLKFQVMSEKHLIIVDIYSL